MNVSIMEEEIGEFGNFVKESNIRFSRRVKAGRRIYYLDVKESNNGELFLVVTESKRIENTEEEQNTQFEKHKIFIYPKDFEKITSAIKEALEFIKRHSK